MDSGGTSNTKLPYYKTQAGADKALIDIFGGPDNVRMPRAEIYKRNRLSEEGVAKKTSAKWVSAKLMALRNFGYGDSKSKKDGTLDMAILSDAGRERIRKLNGTNDERVKPGLGASELVTFETVWRDVRILRQQNPSFSIGFTIEPVVPGGEPIEQR